jgi:hypothetical protein
MERGFWITDPQAEAGLVLYGENGAAVTINGQPYMLTWQQLTDAARRAPPRA